MTEFLCVCHCLGGWISPTAQVNYLISSGSVCESVCESVCG